MPRPSGISSSSSSRRLPECSSSSPLTEVLLQNVLTIRWRAFLNTYYVGEWLGDGTHYRMQLIGREADNPDQRISEDLRKFVESTYSLSVGLMNQAATLVSFVAILWTISRGFTFPGTNFEVPGLLVWVCVAYAILGTWVTHLIGRPLIGLNFQQERVEAELSLLARAPARIHRAGRAPAPARRPSEQGLRPALRPDRRQLHADRRSASSSSTPSRRPISRPTWWCPTS